MRKVTTIARVETSSCPRWRTALGRARDGTTTKFRTWTNRHRRAMKTNRSDLAVARRFHRLRCHRRSRRQRTTRSSSRSTIPSRPRRSRNPQLQSGTIILFRPSPARRFRPRRCRSICASVCWIHAGSSNATSTSRRSPRRTSTRRVPPSRLA
uniref:(northern house mosquito) hypothetical protein n=1 Tax=Culex pipiens TaxID=7175 RepID=A0A8D8HQE6_CULPI